MPNHLGFKKSLARRWRSRGALSGEIRKKNLYLSGLALTPFYDVMEERQTFTTERLDSKRTQKCRELQGSVVVQDRFCASDL